MVEFIGRKMDQTPAREWIQSDGTFVLTTYELGDGAVAGTHRVRVTCYEGQSPATRPLELHGLGESLIPEKYSVYSSSGLQVEVAPAMRAEVVLHLRDEP